MIERVGSWSRFSSERNVRRNQIITILLFACVGGAVACFARHWSHTLAHFRSAHFLELMGMALLAGGAILGIALLAIYRTDLRHLARELGAIRKSPGR